MTSVSPFDRVWVAVLVMALTVVPWAVVERYLLSTGEALPGNAMPFSGAQPLLSWVMAGAYMGVFGWLMWVACVLVVRTGQPTPDLRRAYRSLSRRELIRIGTILALIAVDTIPSRVWRLLLGAMAVITL